jgi:hypothetical protein
MQDHDLNEQAPQAANCGQCSLHDVVTPDIDHVIHHDTQ